MLAFFPESTTGQGGANVVADSGSPYHLAYVLSTRAGCLYFSVQVVNTVPREGVA